MRVNWIVLAFAVLDCRLIISPAFGDEEVKKRFLADYEPAAKFLNNLYTKNRQIKMIEVNYGETGELWSKFEHHYLSNETCVLAERSLLVRTTRRAGKPVGEPVEPPEIKWFLLRPDFLFVIAPVQQSGEHVLTEMTQVVSREDAVKNNPISNIYLPLTYRGVPIANYVQRPEVTVLELSESSWMGRQLMRLRISEPGPPNNVVWTRSFYFDPNDNWLLYGIESQMAGSSQIVVQRNHYHSINDGISIPVKVELHSEQQGKLQRRGWEIEYTDFSSAHPDVGEFSLQRFGLPEPARSTVRQSRFLYVFIFFLASSVALIAALITRRARNKKRGIS